MKRLVLACAGLVALATGFALAPMVTATAATPQSTASAAHWTSRVGTTGAPRLVNLRAISKVTRGQHHAVVSPFRHVTRGGNTPLRAPAIQSGAQHASVRTLPAPRSASISTTADFPMTNYNTQLSNYGFEVEPPDTQVAANSSDVVEAVNDTLSVWSKTGSLMMATDLNVFFSVPTTQFFTDPRVLYDNQSGRWFLSGWSLDSSNNSRTYLAVSATSDPTGSWYFFPLEVQKATLTDQPMIGVCDDKVVMAWDEFTGTTSLTYRGAQAMVLGKSALTSDASSVPFVVFTNPSQFRLVPAQSLSTTTTCYMAVNNASWDLPGSTTSPTLGVIGLTGTPVTGVPTSVRLTETDLPIAMTNAPPAPQQPGGAVEPAANNDDAFLSAVWQNNQLWTSATDACTPPGDTTVRNCMRLDEVNTSAPTPSVSQDFDVATPGLDEYYPAVSVDSSGNVFVAFSASSSTQFAGAYATISPASTASFTAPITIQAGAANYVGFSGSASNRWGDYSGAALDPSTGEVWVAGEYAPSDAGTGDWGTAAAELSLPAGLPAITSADQATFTEASSGSFAVTASGTPAPTFSPLTGAPPWVSFDQTTGVLSGTPTPGSEGSYPIQITASNTVGSVAQTINLTVNPAGSLYTPVGPVRILDTRNGTGGYSKPVGGNSFISLQVTGQDGVPTTATAVVLNVTATNPTLSSYVTVYPDGTTRSSASSLNFTAGETIPNLVVVPVVDGKVDFYNLRGTVNLVADLQGYYSAGTGSAYTPVGPVRVLDTRNGTGGYSSPVGPNSTIFLQLNGKDGLPISGVTAVVLNVTATNPTSSSFVSVYPNGIARPSASNLNFTAGETIPNLVVVPVSGFGWINLYNHTGSVNLVADLAGYYTAGGKSAYTPVGPVRVLDTRNGTGGYSKPVGGNSFISLQVDGVGQVPASGVTAVVLNVTATNPTLSSYVTVYPDGTTRSSASSLNFTAGETIPNLVVVPVVNGKVDFYNLRGTVNLVADLAGYYTN